MVYYVATADISRDDVVVQTFYLKQHENGVMGMDKLTNQIAYANQKYSDPSDPQYISEYYNVVAGVNASFYNMTTGQPMGITYIDGVSFGTSSYDNFFAILKDGKTAVIDYAKNIGMWTPTATARFGRQLRALSGWCATGKTCGRRCIQYRLCESISGAGLALSVHRSERL